MLLLSVHCSTYEGWGLTQDNRVGREDGEVRVQFLVCQNRSSLDLMKAYEDKVQLVGGRADAVCEEQGVALEPGDLLGGELVTGAGTRHVEMSSIVW